MHSCGKHNGQTARSGFCTKIDTEVANRTDYVGSITIVGFEDMRKHMPNEIWKIRLVSRTIGADRGRAARGRPGQL